MGEACAGAVVGEEAGGRAAQGLRREGACEGGEGQGSEKQGRRVLLTGGWLGEVKHAKSTKEQEQEQQRAGAVLNRGMRANMTQGPRSRRSDGGGHMARLVWLGSAARTGGAVAHVATASARWSRRAHSGCTWRMAQTSIHMPAGKEVHVHAPVRLGERPRNVQNGRSSGVIGLRRAKENSPHAPDAASRSFEQPHTTTHRSRTAEQPSRHIIFAYLCYRHHRHHRLRCCCILLRTRAISRAHHYAEHPHMRSNNLLLLPLPCLPISMCSTNVHCPRR